jgi:hypothetical protein
MLLENVLNLIQLRIRYFECASLVGILYTVVSFVLFHRGYPTVIEHLLENAQIFLADCKVSIMLFMNCSQERLLSFGRFDFR